MRLREEWSGGWGGNFGENWREQAWRVDEIKSSLEPHPLRWF